MNVYAYTLCTQSIEDEPASRSKGISVELQTIEVTNGLIGMRIILELNLRDIAERLVVSGDDIATSRGEFRQPSKLADAQAAWISLNR